MPAPATRHEKKEDFLELCEFATRSIHVGHNPADWPGHPVTVGISTSSTFEQKTPGVNNGYDYSRSGNPTRQTLEKNLASLEGAKYCLTFASGLATTTNITLLLTAKDSVLCMDDVYGGTNRLLNRVMAPFGLSVHMVDFTDMAKLSMAMRDHRPKLIWVETPTNPLLKVVDIEAVTKMVKSMDDRCIVVIDNTFQTPVFQNPLKQNADIVIHSITKYINGHSDVVMGCLMTNNKRLYDQLAFLQNAAGSVPSPFDCYLVLRGIKTLSLRMQQHYRSSLAVASFLEKHPAVEKVFYPGLPSHPQHHIHKKQCTGCSGMISFVTRGDGRSAQRFIADLNLFSLAESLGGFESLIELPYVAFFYFFFRAVMTHASVPGEQRMALGIGDTLIRLSVGLENTEDLIRDLDQALQKI